MSVLSTTFKRATSPTLAKGGIKVAAVLSSESLNMKAFTSSPMFISFFRLIYYEEVYHLLCY